MRHPTQLNQLGWSPMLERGFRKYREEGADVGRVAVQHKTQYLLYTTFGEMPAELSGKARFTGMDGEDLPVVGDWVVIRVHAQRDRATIHLVLPRASRFSRKMAGKTTQQQVLAANFETVFLVTLRSHEKTR